jgi:hypothetical protein
MGFFFEKQVKRRPSAQPAKLGIYRLTYYNLQQTITIRTQQNIGYRQLRLKKLHESRSKTQAFIPIFLLLEPSPALFSRFVSTNLFLLLHSSTFLLDSSFCIIAHLSIQAHDKNMTSSGGSVLISFKKYMFLINE